MAVVPSRSGEELGIVERVVITALNELRQFCFQLGADIQRFQDLGDISVSGPNGFRFVVSGGLGDTIRHKMNVRIAGGVRGYPVKAVSEKLQDGIVQRVPSITENLTAGLQCLNQHINVFDVIFLLFPDLLNPLDLTAFTSMVV